MKNSIAGHSIEGQQGQLGIGGHEADCLRQKSCPSSMAVNGCSSVGMLQVEMGNRGSGGWGGGHSGRRKWLSS